MAASVTKGSAAGAKIQELIGYYLKLEKDIEESSIALKQKRDGRDKLCKEIIAFCTQKGLRRITLPDGSALTLNKSNKYQSLSFGMLEKTLQEYNKKSAHKIQVKHLLDFIKSQRDVASQLDLRHA